MTRDRSKVRQRAGVILFVDGRLAVIDRYRPDVGRYQVLPGGGVEPGESLAQAAAREAWEETGLHVQLEPQPSLRLTHPRQIEWLFRATPLDGTFGTGTGLPNDRHRPTLTTHRELAAMNLVPAVIAETLLRAWSTGTWWDQPIHLTDPDTKTAARVRGGAIIVRDNHILLIERNHGTDRWYEIPGGGVEPGETPADAALRELHEETGLSATAAREVAIVFKDGHRQHYFRAEAAGPIGQPAALDLDDQARPVWIPLSELADTAVWPKRLAWRIARWSATSWPDTPVRLSDTITDLTTACDW